LNPNDSKIHTGYSHYLMVQKRFDEALAENRRAINLAPLDILGSIHLAWLYFDAREADKTIAQSQRHVIDLFFPLPANMDASHLPQFDLVWRVDTAARAVAQRTSFDRESDASQGAGYAVGYGSPYWYPYDYAYGAWGPYWWYDPFYPTVGFVHPGYIGRPWGGGRVYVGRPSWRGGGGRIGGGGKIGSGGGRR